MPRSKIAEGVYVGRPEWARECPFVEAKVSTLGVSPSVADIVLQIDSGADVTMVPMMVLALPGLREVGTQVIRGVNGQAVGYPVVELCFGLGHVRVPSVRVCLVDREVGLLGRDLLDLVVLELDGLNKRWSMSR